MRLDEDEQRWLDAGRVLRRLDPVAFEAMLAGVEVTIAEQPDAATDEHVRRVPS